MYVFIPLIHRSSQKAAIATAFVCCTIVYGVFLAVLAMSGNPNLVELELRIYAEPPVYLAFYGFGILAYLRTFPKWCVWLAPAGLAVIGFFGGFPDVALKIFPDLFVETLAFSVGLFPFLIGFAAILTYPPPFLKWFVVAGEESYALYAVHFVFIATFGLIGVAYALLAAFGIEFCLRPGEISRRIGAVFGPAKLVAPRAGYQEGQEVPQTTNVRVSKCGETKSESRNRSTDPRTSSMSMPPSASRPAW